MARMGVERVGVLNGWMDACRTACFDAVAGETAGRVVRMGGLVQRHLAPSAPSGQRVSTRKPPSAP